MRTLQSFIDLFVFHTEPLETLVAREVDQYTLELPLKLIVGNILDTVLLLFVFHTKLQLYIMECLGWLYCIPQDTLLYSGLKLDRK